jgi:hypothetical protein
MSSLDIPRSIGKIQAVKIALVDAHVFKEVSLDFRIAKVRIPQIQHIENRCGMWA